TLATGVRVNLSVHHEDVHVAAAGKHVVQAAVTDVISPAVTTDDPNAATDKVIGDGEEHFSFATGVGGKFLFKRNDSGTLLKNAGFIRLVRCGQAGDKVVAEFRGEAFEQFTRKLTLFVNGRAETESEFRVILKERIAPGRAAALFVFGVRRRREVAAINRG